MNIKDAAKILGASLKIAQFGIIAQSPKIELKIRNDTTRFF